MSFELKLLLWFMSLDEKSQSAVIRLLEAGWRVEFKDESLRATLVEP